MFTSTFISAAVLLGLAPAVMAAGSAIVINNCGSEVYFASVGQSSSASMSPLSGSYSEAYSKPGVGVSIKLSPSASGPVTQFEYTWSGGSVAYDISNIDGNPFMSGGMSLTPSMAGASGYPTCQTVSCPAGQSTCSQAYNAPDDVRTMVCPEDSDLTMTLCPGGSSKRETSEITLEIPQEESAEKRSEFSVGSFFHLGKRMHPRQFK